VTPKEEIEHLLAQVGPDALAHLTEQERREANALLAKPLWEPQPGNIPQQMACKSRIDVVGFGGSSGGGKLLDLRTPIPTPFGFRALSEIHVGDSIFGRDGLSHVVLAESQLVTAPAYRLTFDDGAEVIAHDDHLWLTFDANELEQLTRLTPKWREARRQRRLSRSAVGTGQKTKHTQEHREFLSRMITERNRKTAAAKLPPPRGTVRSTAEIVATLRVDNRTNHAIPVSEPIERPEQALPLDPYILGVWLGDGTTANGDITTADAEITQAVVDAGFPVRRIGRKKDNKAATYAHHGLRLALKEIEVLGNKEIPHAYLWGSKAQRLALLQGLLDTDGGVESGSVGFTNTRKNLVDGVAHLARSLGHKVTVRQGIAKLYGRFIGPKWIVKFRAKMQVFRLKAKAEKLKFAVRQTTNFRYIVAAERTEPVTMKCLQVNTEDHLFLVSEHFIPTHNSQVILGKALTQHRRSLIIRREAKDLQALIDACREIVGKQGSFNANLNIWRDLPGGRTIQFGGLKDPGDEQHFRGNPHDLIGLDEADQIPEYQARFVMGWLRTTDKNQHCQVIICFNPPHDPEGEWLIRFFAPWLDDEHPNKALPGEPRWFAMVNGKETEFTKPDKIKIGDEWVTPKSRTFFPARVQDNRALFDTGYLDTLLALPSPLREQLAYGDFKIGRVDGAWQAIPTSFIKAAQKRWTPSCPFPGKMTALGADISRGGTGATCTAPLYGTWFGELEAVRGPATDTGRKAANIVKARHKDGCPINMDMNGLGVACYEHLQEMLGPQSGLLRGLNPGDPSDLHESSGKFQLMNLRAAMVWSFREALDPENGSTIALPPDDELAQDLAAPRYQVVGDKIKIEMKSDVEKRLGRSVDRGDAVVMAWWQSSGVGTVQGHGDRNKEWGLGVPLQSTSFGYGDEEESILLFGDEPTPDREDKEWWQDL